MTALEDIAKPIAIESIHAGHSDVFCLFLKAIYEDYDLDLALSLVEQMGEESNNDILLKTYAFDIKKQAYLLIFQIKCKLFRSIAVAEIAQAMSFAGPVAPVLEDLKRHIADNNFDCTVTDKLVTCQPSRSNVGDNQIQRQAYDLFQKTQQLTKLYQDHSKQIKESVN